MDLNIKKKIKKKKAMGNRCVVQSCGDCKTRNPYVKFFKFPSVKERESLWLSLCKINKESGKNLRVCRKHFEQRYIHKKKLKTNAVPTLFMDTPTSKNSLNELFENLVDSETETSSSADSNNRCMMVKF